MMPTSKYNQTRGAKNDRIIEENRVAIMADLGDFELSGRDIAKKWGLSENRVIVLGYSLGIDMKERLAEIDRRRKALEISGYEVAVLYDLKRTKSSAKQIAGRHGISQDRVAAVAKRHGIDLRERMEVATHRRERTLKQWISDHETMSRDSRSLFWLTQPFTANHGGASV